ncbi:MAG: aminoacyl-tRNA hydrolase [Thermoanaerobacteraceae bacterium]|nr:aminoacyl-tRNA hydrolase [Thermoanaerobacteraceae bacterium]
MRIVVGIGNPGREYAMTRHNIGFMVVDELTARYNVSFKEKFKGLIGETIIGNEKVLLVKPLTYVNNSGHCVLDTVSFYKLSPQDIIVICDDINLPLGKIRIRKKGSDGGHNGMKSIIYNINSEDFPRVRIGIDSPQYDMVSHVLGRFTEEEMAVMKDSIKKAADSVECIVKDGIDTAMNRYNPD